MNERIQELMWDAGLNSNYVEGFDSIYSKQLEKFAELIIREYSYDCMDVTSNSEHIQFVAKKWGVEL